MKRGDNITLRCLCGADNSFPYPNYLDFEWTCSACGKQLRSVISKTGTITFDASAVYEPEREKA